MSEEKEQITARPEDPEKGHTDHPPAPSVENNPMITPKLRKRDTTDV